MQNLISKEDTLISILESHGPLQSNELKRYALKKGIKERTFYNVIQKAVNKGKIRKHQISQIVYYYLPNQEEKLHEKLIEIDLFSKNIPYEDRKSHSKDLIVLIRRWRWCMPIVNEKGVFGVDINGSHSGPVFKIKEEKTEVENHPLFEDLKNHLDQSIFEDWKKFKEKSEEYWEKIENGKSDENLMDKLMEIRERLKNRLEDYEYYQVLPGICKYLVGSSRSF